MFVFMGINLYVSSRQKETSIINVLGKKRMLSQKISKEVLAWYKFGMQKSIKSLKNFTNSFSKVIQAQTNGKMMLGDKSIELGMESEFKSITEVEKSIQGYIKTGEELSSIITMIEDINKISSQNSASENEISGASEHLTSMTEDLNNKLNQFKAK